MKSTRKAVVVCILALLANASQSWAKAGLSTRFGDVFVENLDIGQSYNTRELANLPLKVTNTGDDTIDLMFDVQIPKVENIKEHLQKEGYAPIPDLSWIRLTKDRFLVPAGESAFSDVILTIPDDPALYGKKFQVDIWSHGTPKSFLNLGIYSHLMFTVLPSPQSRQETAQLKKRGLAANLNFDLVPDKVYLSDVALGAKTTLKGKSQAIKIINTNSFPLKFFIKMVPLSETPLTLQQGFEEPADPSWMKVLTETMTVGANSIKDIDARITIPNEEKYRGKNYMFILKVEPDTDKVVLVSYYGKVYVTTK